MKNFLQKVAAAYSHVVHSKPFFMILSGLIGIFLWLYNINIVNPLKTAEYTKVPVKIDLVGSVPSNYGLSFTQNTPVLNVTVSVEGSRTSLLNFSKEKLNAYLDLNAVTSSGGYTLPIIVKSADSSVTVTSVEPSMFFCEFDTTTTKTFRVELNTSGSLPDGYILENYKITPSSVTVTGPSSVVSQVAGISLPISLSDHKESFSGNEAILLLNSEQDSIPRASLELSDDAVEYLMSLSYCKKLPLRANLVNYNGGNELPFFEIAYSVNEVLVTGAESDLAGIQEINLGNIPTETITDSVSYNRMVLPVNSSFNYRPDQTSEVIVTLSSKSDVSTKTLMFNATDIASFTFINVPEGKKPVVTTKSMSLTVRGFKSDLNNLSKSRVTGVIDLSSMNSSGEYNVQFYFPDGVNYGLLNRVTVGVDYVVEPEEPLTE